MEANSDQIDDDLIDWDDYHTFEKVNHHEIQDF